MEAGQLYVEAGATATDAKDGDLSASVVVDTSLVNAGRPGTYVVSYRVTDSDGKQATAQRTVKVIDTTKPKIVLKSTVVISELRGDGPAGGGDMVGMGTSPGEGTSLPKPDGRTLATYERLGGGAYGSCVDTGDNSADFVLRLSQDLQNLVSAFIVC